MKARQSCPGGPGLLLSFHEDRIPTRARAPIGCSLTTEELLGTADYGLSGKDNMNYLVEKKHRFHIPSVENSTPLTYLESDFYKIFH